MDKAAVWIGYVVMLAGGMTIACLFLWLAAEGLWRAWRTWTGLFNIVEAFDALREKQAAAAKSAGEGGKTL